MSEAAERPPSLGPPAAALVTAEKEATRPRGRLFRKYMLLPLALVSAVLFANSAVNFWFSWQQERVAAGRIIQEKADAAARRIQAFIDGIEQQIGWTTIAQWARGPLDERRFDFERLLHQVPAIASVQQLDANGRDQLEVSRLSMDVVGSGKDFSTSPAFIEARAHRVWYGPVHFRKQSEPYMTVAVAGAGPDAGVTVAEVNLKLIWDVVSGLKIGERGDAFVVDDKGRLIAHPDISLVLRETDLSHLPQVAATLAGGPHPAVVADNIAGNRVLTAHAPIERLGWFVFVELPMREALAPLYAAAARDAALVLLGLLLASVAASLLARRMVVPIRAIAEGAARLSRGELDRRLDVNTGDELQTLADEFNHMADALEKSYGELEHKVEARTAELHERTAELGRSVEELKLLSDVGQAVSSTLDLRAVLSTVLSRSVGITGADAGAVFLYRQAERAFQLVEAVGWDAALLRLVSDLKVPEGESAMGEATERRMPIQHADLATRSSYPLRDATLAAGFRAVLIVPLVGLERVLGALILTRRATGEFPVETVRLMQTLASQSVLAIQNARMFRELAEKSAELELASQHKSQFLTNMSHELRTPLNAILGYAELLIHGIYGELSDRTKGALERIQSSGRHLLALINDILDLARIEAGQLRLSLEDYSFGELVRSAVTATEPLATAKGLKLATALPDDLPTAHGDARRVSQVLLNLLGNAIKFTDEGEVEVHASAKDGHFLLTVRDTGPGIAEADQERIFGEFQQIDNSSTRKKGGTGLGLAISKRIVEMQGGTISVESQLGQGSIFRVTLPVRVEEPLELTA